VTISAVEKKEFLVKSLFAELQQHLINIRSPENVAGRTSSKEKK
jgi:hypothetical protein